MYERYVDDAHTSRGICEVDMIARNMNTYIFKTHYSTHLEQAIHCEHGAYTLKPTHLTNLLPTHPINPLTTPPTHTPTHSPTQPTDSPTHPPRHPPTHPRIQIKTQNHPVTSPYNTDLTTQQLTHALIRPSIHPPAYRAKCCCTVTWNQLKNHTNTILVKCYMFYNVLSALPVYYCGKLLSFHFRY